MRAAFSAKSPRARMNVAGRSLAFFGFFWLLLVAAPQAQPVRMEPEAIRYANSITVRDLRRHLRVIASDSLEGRETGTRGQRMAADYIANHFANIGLTPPMVDEEGQPSYQQNFYLERITPGEIYLRVGNTRYENFTDFYAFGQPYAPQERPLSVVFAGYGIDTDQYSDYDKLKVQGNAVLVRRGEPFDAQGRNLATGQEGASAWASDWRLKVRAARERGAALVLLAQEQDAAAFESAVTLRREFLGRPALSLSRPQRESFGVFFVSPRLATDLLRTNEATLFASEMAPRTYARYRKRLGRRAQRLGYRAELQRDSVQSSNVLGVVEGTDRRDEYVVITAHYDHLGITDSTIYNGADDDGSGTVAVMELAEAFARAREAGVGPRRSIVFMAVSGEEKGLLGSSYYVENPAFPLEQTVTNLNIDMIGRVDEAHEGNPDYVYIIGSDMLSTELHEISEAVNDLYSQLDLDYRYNGYDDPNRFYFRSDHYNFARKGIPVIFYFNGVHEDYHQPTDEVDKIHFNKMEKIARLVFYTAWEVANRNERPVVDVEERK